MKEHLLPRIRTLLLEETDNAPIGNATTEDARDDWQNVILKHDRIYAHKIMRIHYTTYDVRRGEDLIHTGTPQCNIMVLSPGFSDKNIGSEHPFWYGRVLGVYHANVIYIGKGSDNYQPRRLDFLWVRWYHFNDRPCGWQQLRLDKLHFPPLAESGSFGFLDPNHVLRSAHIIPHLSGGKVHSDGTSTSHLAQSGADWNTYVINRYVLNSSTTQINSSQYFLSFVDRDMIMRHYWGLGVGHTYARMPGAVVRSTYLTRHRGGECDAVHSQALGELPENADEESDLGDDDMVFFDDDGDWDSDGSSICGDEN